MDATIRQVPRIAPASTMVNEFVETTQTLPKHNF
jgi:hypothetical protein